MSSLQLNLPESIRRGVAEAAARDAVSVDQFVATALAEKLAALMTEDYLGRRAARADRSKFDAALAKAPDVEPDPADALPADENRSPRHSAEEIERSRQIRQSMTGMVTRYDRPFDPAVPPEDWHVLRDDDPNPR